MAISTYIRSLFLLPVLLLATPTTAQLSDLRLPVLLDADFTDYDGKNSMLMFRGLRLTQGNLGVVADKGQASKLDFENSVWKFTGNVRIDTGNGHIECESADLRFSGYQLQRAILTGFPATFELARPESDQTTYAEAGRLEYDFAAGVIEFTDQATITEGGNQISSNYLLYNIREQRINAQSNGNADEKVKIIYTPGVNGTAQPADASPVEPDPAGESADDTGATPEASGGDGAR